MIPLLMVLGVLAFTLGPLLLIWSINTLFMLGISYNISTWAASLVLLVLLGSQTYHTTVK